MHELVLSSHHVCPVLGIGMRRLDSKCLHLLSHLANPKVYFKKIYSGGRDRQLFEFEASLIYTVSGTELQLETFIYLFI